MHAIYIEIGRMSGECVSTMSGIRREMNQWQYVSSENDLSTNINASPVIFIFICVFSLL